MSYRQIPGIEIYASDRLASFGAAAKMRAETHSNRADRFMLVFEQATDGGLIALPFSEAEPEIQRVMDEDYLIHSDLTQYLYWDLPKKTGVSLYEVLASDAALFGVARVERQSESPRNESYALLCTTSITQTLYRIERAAITGIEQKIVTALGEMVQNLRGLVSVDFPDLTPNDKIYYVENP